MTNSELLKTPFIPIFHKYFLSSGFKLKKNNSRIDLKMPKFDLLKLLFFRNFFFFFLDLNKNIVLYMLIKSKRQAI